MRRFIADATRISSGSDKIIINNQTEVNHIKNVLRMTEGEYAVVSDGVGFDYTTIISEINANYVMFDIISKEESSAEPNHDITLFQCMPKKGKLELIIQKAVELGVSAIVPVFSERSVVKSGDNDGRKHERWNKVSAEAVKQCRRTVVPNVALPVKISELPVMLKEYDLVIMPYENEQGRTIKSVLQESLSQGDLKNLSSENSNKLNSELNRIAVIIGPEGGFSEKEEKLLTSGGAMTCSLGKTILRTETAAIATIAMMMYELELKGF